MAMRYVSTRGHVPPTPYCEVVKAGFAKDGGLFVPERGFPIIPRDRLGLMHSDKPKYTDFVFELTFPYTDGVDAESYRRIIEKGFRKEAWGDDPLPIERLNDKISFLELWHGPSGAFKDCAMQPLGYEYEYWLTESGEVITIIVSTSGDTGPAAVESFRGRKGIVLAVFYPKNGTSTFQAKQMTTRAGGNIFVVPIAGSFDDGQAIVKALGTRPALVKAMNLCGVNSINWGRVKFQIPYYPYAWSRVASGVSEYITVVVPTGNFGNIYAGFDAMQMGVPIRLVMATNENRVLVDLFHDGIYRPWPEEIKTMSPSMNITKASNPERLLYWLTGGDADRVRAYMEELNCNGFFKLDRAHFRKLRECGICADFATDAQCKAAMDEVYKKYGYIMDPHTAVAYVVAKRLHDVRGQIVILSTAAPYKFTPAVYGAIGRYPDRPARFIGFEERADAKAPYVMELTKDPDEAERYLREVVRAAA